MHQSIPAAPSPPPRADPRALAFFWPWMANSRGWGLLSCQTPRGGDEKRGQMPRPPFDFLFQLTSFFAIALRQHAPVYNISIDVK